MGAFNRDMSKRIVETEIAIFFFQTFFFSSNPWPIADNQKEEGKKY